MDLLTAWLIFPVVALLVCGGLGLLLSRASGDAVPGTLLCGVGFCGLVVVSQLVTAWSWAAPGTVGVVIALAVGGAVAGRARLRAMRPDLWAVAAGVATFGMAGAPVVLSGEATFAGYTVLADTSIHLMGADALLERGRDFLGLAPSSYQGALVSYYNGSAYPSGAPTALGTLARVTGEDPMWTFSPFMALLLALLALSLYALAGAAVRRGPVRAAIAVVAAQPAIVTTYALQGSVKEIGAASLTGLLAALVPWYAERREAGDGPGAVAVLAVVTAAACAVVGAVALVWAGPLVLVAVLLGHRRAPVRRTADLWVTAVVLAALVAVLSVQTISGINTYLDVTNSGRTPEARTGNLKQDLSPAQATGVWLRGDHRDRPAGAQRAGTIALQLLVGLTTLAAAVLLARRRIWPPVVFLAVMLGAMVVLVWQGTPWSDAKAYMITAPAVMFTALLGAAVLFGDPQLRWPRRAAAAGVAGVIALGVVASNALAYREVSLAPRERFEELAAIAERFDGQGPALTPEYEEFGKYVLRDIAPESPVEGWRSRDLQLATPDDPPDLFGTSVEHGQFADAYVRQFPLLVLRRGFSESRAPAGYSRVHAGRWYDVWRRDPGAEDLVLTSLPLGTGRQAAAEPSCADVRDLATRARRAGGELAYVSRAVTPVFAPGRVRHSWNWLTDTGDEDVVILFGPGRADGAVRVPAGGTYDVWMEARLGRPAEVLVDGQVVGEVSRRLNPRRSAELVGRVDLDAGRHTIEVRVGGGGAAPGMGGVNRIIGPVALVASDPGALAITRLAPERWRDLCGQPLDWIAAVRPGR
ncbi:MAG: hypothetical protein JHC84_01860 [Solirubrobacteraceae bacterium]|nr:hypothetical protein [Solirubrobacteraceae bacterium]